MSPRLILLGLACLPCAVGCWPQLIVGVPTRPPVTVGGVPNCIAFSPDGTTLAVGCRVGEGGVVRLLDANTRECKRELPAEVPVERVTFSPDGKHVGLLGWRGAGWLSLTAEPTPANLPLPHADLPWAITADGRALAMIRPIGSPATSVFAGGRSLTIRSLAALDQPDADAQLFTTPIETFALATEHGPVAYVDGDGRVRIRELTAGSVPILLPHRDQDEIGQLAFSADGKRLVAASYERHSKGDRLVVWNVVSRCILREFGIGKGSDQRQLVLSRDGGHLIINDPGDATVWDLATCEQLFPNAAIRHAAFSPDGRRVALLAPRSGMVEVISLPGPN